MAIGAKQVLSIQSKLKQLVPSLQIVCSMAEQITNQLANDKEVDDDELRHVARLSERLLQSLSKTNELIKEYEKKVLMF